MKAPYRESRARLLAYVPWILRDYTTNQGPATIVVMLLVGTSMLGPLMNGPLDMEFGEVPAELAMRMLQAMITPFAFLGPFFATNGIIANDRKFSFYRFLFAKPLSPVAYYVVTFLVYGIGMLIVTALLLGLWSTAVRPMLPVRLFGIVALMYLAFGGIGFLLSAAWRYDWLSLVSVLFIASVAWGQWADTTGPLRLPLYLLPPVHRASEVYASVAGGPAPWPAILWLGGYGFVCFLLGMLVIRQRPLGTS